MPYVFGSSVLEAVPSVEYDATHFKILTVTYISDKKERADIRKGYEGKMN
jgi:hypothetical protein